MSQSPETTAPEAPRKPLIFADSMYASDRRDGTEFRHATVDGMYVPGYSEERSKNEIRRARGQKETPLPHLAWVRVKRVDGTLVSHGDSQLTNYRLLGYRAMGQAELESLQKSLGLPGLEMPPTAHVDQQGLIVKEDTALFIVDHERAQENRQKLDSENAKLQEGADLQGSPVYRDVKEERKFRGSLKEIQQIELPE